MPRDDDVHAGARVAAHRILEECGLFRGRGAPTREDVKRVVESVKLEGGDRPTIPSPWRVGEAIAGANIALATIVALLEGSRGRECNGTIDVDQAAWIAWSLYSCRWEIEGGGLWTENVALHNQRLAAKLAAQKPASAQPTPIPTEELVDPPPGTPDMSPIFAPLRIFLSECFRTKDRHIMLFPRVTDHPGPYLAAVGFSPEEVAHLLRLGIVNPVTHPKTYLKHHDELVRLLREGIEKRMAFEIETRVAAIPAIAIVPRTREEFEATEQGLVLSKLPRTAVERVHGIRGPRSVAEWQDVLHGRAQDDAEGLWPEIGWKFGSVPRPMPSRGVLYGIKVLDLTRIVAGPMLSLQLAQLGADVMRISSADVFDYPSYDFVINLNKRTVEMNLKLEADKAKLRSLILEADVIINNMLLGALEKLGFGLQDVLKLIKDRPRGIVYAETNTYGFYGPLAPLPGIELLGQHYTGMTYEQGRFQPFTDGSSMPAITPPLACDVTTGLNTAVGVLVALHRRAKTGGSYLVRGSLAQTGLYIQDLGMYKDEDMVRKLWDGLPKHSVGMVADPTTVEANGATEYHLRFPRFLIQRGDRGGQWDSGFWYRMLDYPIGGSIVSFLPTIRLSLHDPGLRHIRFFSRQLRHDSHVGFLFDPEDPESSDEGVRDMVLVATAERTYRCRPENELRVLIDAFLAAKRAARTGEPVQMPDPRL
ncbi:hypothetical protein DFJ74DRAFT_27776 [Hyaloraphidium curvatum]|nr:hypothetical protein DFJ74DRAFT_27776 [Hyaloraphidium curvatum]